MTMIVSRAVLFGGRSQGQCMLRKASRSLGWLNDDSIDDMLRKNRGYSSNSHVVKAAWLRPCLWEDSLAYIAVIEEQKVSGSYRDISATPYTCKCYLWSLLPLLALRCYRS